MVMLKVLHVNDSGLNDPRIVNAAITGKKAGYDVYFCGMKLESTLTTDVFAGMKWIKFSDKARVAKRLMSFVDHYWYWYPYPRHAIWIEKQLKQVIEEIRPDIIHAHNIFAGHYASAFGMPMVLDDHEFYSVETQAKSEGMKNIGSRIRARVKTRRWSEWEREFGEHHPIITVSTQIAEYHNRYCKHVFVLPNYPRQDAIKLNHFNEAQRRHLCSVYIGADSAEDPSAIRDISGLHDIFSNNTEVGELARIGVSSPNTRNIRSFGFLPMDEAYRIMQQHCHVGLLPWKRHWFHKYCNPNKVYEYAHCGLWLITIDDLPSVVKDFGTLCDTFQSYEELSELLAYYNTHPDELNEKRLRSIKHARTNLTWEREEHKILDAYKVA